MPPFPGAGRGLPSAFSALHLREPWPERGPCREVPSPFGWRLRYGMPTEGKPPSGAGGQPSSGPQATSPDLEDTDHGWSEPPPPTPDTTPDGARPPGFPPPPPLPATRVAELHATEKPSLRNPLAPPAAAPAAAGSSPRAGSSPQLGSSPRAGSSPRIVTSPSVELPVPTVPAKEPSSPTASLEPPVAPAPPAAIASPSAGAPPAPPPLPVSLPAANPALAATAPHAALAPVASQPVLPVPNPALAATEPSRAAMPVPGAAPVEGAPAFPVPPAFPVAPALPPPVPMSSVSPMAERPLLVSPVAKPASATPSDAALASPGFFAKLGASRPSGAWLLIGLLVVLLAFGGGLLTGRSLAPVTKNAAVEEATPEKKTPAAKTPSASEPKPAAETPAPAAEPAAKPTEGGGGAKHPFNRKAAAAAVDRAALRARSCRDSRDPAGSVSATVTFAPSGRVSDVSVTTPRYANTKTGRCIVTRLSEARVPDFSGAPVTVKKSLVVK